MINTAVYSIPLIASSKSFKVLLNNLDDPSVRDMWICDSVDVPKSETKQKSHIE